MKLKWTQTMVMLGVGFVLTGSLTSTGQCAIVVESAPNDTRATATFIAPSFFTPNFDPNVFGNNPTATILGSLDAGDSIDFYSFLGVGGSATYLDIDNDPFTFDSILSLFDSNGTLLAFADDTDPDPGSTGNFDPFLGVYTLPSTQTYYAAVTRYISLPNASSSGTRTFLDRPDGAVNNAMAVSGATFGDDSFGGPVRTGNGAYKLNITTSALPATAPVPEPGTMSLMALGLTGLVGAARRRKQTEAEEFA